MPERQTLEMKSLFFLGSAIKEGGRRRLQMQLRQRFLNLACLLLLLISQRNITVSRPVPFLSSAEKKYWHGSWEIVYNTHTDARFKNTFRVSRETFNFIQNRIALFINRQAETEVPITPALRLAFCLYRLGRGDYLYTISEMFELGFSTVSSVCQEVCHVLVDHLWNEYASD